VPTKLIIGCLRLVYLAAYHLSLAKEKLTGRQFWTKELAAYFNLTPKRVLKNYRSKQVEANRLWDKKNRNSLKQFFSFYQETDYFVYRQMWFNRHKAFWDIALPFYLKPDGSYCEYGSGIGPVTNWLIKRFPQWHYTLVDLDCPVFKFAQWRFREKKQVGFKTVGLKKLPLTKKYDVITCKQVLEHVPNPLELIKHLINHLRPGGWLYLDYINEPGGENLTQSAQQRRLVLAYLFKTLRPIFSIEPDSQKEGYGLYQNY